MSPLIQNPDSGRKLQRGFRLTSLPDALLAPEIVGVVLLEDWSEPLGDVARGCTGSADRGNVAGENAHVTLVRVGLGTPYEMIVTRLWFSTTAAQRIAVVQATALAGQVASPNTAFTDFGIPGRPSSQLGTLSQVGVTPGVTLILANVFEDTTYQFDVRWKMGTFGDGIGLTALAIVGLSANTRISAGFDWTESPPLG